MQAKVMAPVFVAFVVAVAAVAVVSAQEELVECPIVDDVGANATLLPNLYNCSTFYMCCQGVRKLMECPDGLQFNRLLQVCDHPYNALCVELPPPEPVLPTTETPVATERVVITKTVKEVYRPVDGEALQL
uniref:Chitin-binding protein n=1 Tax=Rhipicephalus appendiculatus TaxID=34631 RepID=A0A131YH32_RHIAP